MKERTIALAELFTTHPHPIEHHELLQECAAVCLQCSQACIACSDACLAEPAVERLVRCIRTDLDCADVCGATARILSRQTEWNSSVAHVQLEACQMACRICAEECDCRVCEEKCREVYNAIHG